MFGPHHYIQTFDGGRDDLLPNRWLALAQWLGPGHAAYGPTEHAAVDALRQLLAERYPNAPWFTQVPVRTVKVDRTDVIKL